MDEDIFLKFEKKFVFKYYGKKEKQLEFNVKVFRNKVNKKDIIEIDLFERNLIKIFFLKIKFRRYFSNISIVSLDLILRLEEDFI